MIDSRLLYTLKEAQEIDYEKHFWRDFFLHSLDTLTPKKKRQKWEEKYEPLPFSR